MGGRCVLIMVYMIFLAALAAERTGYLVLG